MSVKVVDYHPTIKIKTTRAASLAVYFMLDGIDRTAFPKTPMRKGELRKDTRKSVSGSKGTITWSERYAAVQEAGSRKGVRFTHYTTAGTGPHFAEDAVNKVASDADSYFRKANLI
jgi:hypothetical protein